MWYFLLFSCHLNCNTRVKEFFNRKNTLMMTKKSPTSNAPGWLLVMPPSLLFASWPEPSQALVFQKRRPNTSWKIVDANIDLIRETIVKKQVYSVLQKTGLFGVLPSKMAFFKRGRQIVKVMSRPWASSSTLALITPLNEIHDVVPKIPAVKVELCWPF